MHSSGIRNSIYWPHHCYWFVWIPPFYLAMQTLTGGLYLSRHVERTVMRNHQEQALKKRKQDEKSQQAQEKKRARHAALQSTADTVRQVLLSGIADWQKHLKAQDIKVAANLILHPRSFTSQKEAAPALQEWADAQRAALASRIPALGACSLAA